MGVEDRYMTRKSRSKRIRRSHFLKSRTALITRCIEFLMVFMSLFWTAEAYAKTKENSKHIPPEARVIQNRTPAYATRAPEKPSETSHMAMETVVDPDKGQTKKPSLWQKDVKAAPYGIRTGNTLSNSFKESPYYSPAQAELIRF